MPPMGRPGSAEEQEHEAQEQDRLRKVKLAASAGTAARDTVVRVKRRVEGKEAAARDKKGHHHHHHHHHHDHHPPKRAPYRVQPVKEEDLPSFLKPDPKGLSISGKEKTEHHRTGSVSVNLLIKQTLLGNKTERETVTKELYSLTPRALERFSQSLGDIWRMNRTQAEKLKTEKTNRDIEQARARLKQAQDEAEGLEARAPKKARKVLELKEAQRKNHSEQITSQAREKLNDEKAHDLNRIAARVKDAAEGDRKTRAMEIIAKRRKELVAQDRKQAEELAGLTKDARELQTKIDELHLDPAEQTAVDQYEEARRRAVVVAAQLNQLIDDAEDSPEGEIGKILELAGEIAEAKSRTQGQAAAMGLARAEGKDEASIEGSAGYSGRLTAHGWKGKEEEKLEVKTGTEEDDKKDDPEEDFDFDIDEDVKDANEALRDAKEQKKANLTPQEALKEELDDEKESKMLEERTGITLADAELKADWKAKEFKAYLDCRRAHLDAQLEVMRASIEAKAFAQKDANNLGVATGAELEIALNLLAARVGLHATPLELDFFGEKFVASGTTVLDASIGASLKAQGIAAAAIGHHASGPTAAISAEAEAFVGAKITAAGVFCLDWNKKSATAYRDELGQNFQRFLTYLGLQDPAKAPVTASGDAVGEILAEMGWGDVGDVLIAATEMRVQGQVGAGAEAKARAGFFGGVVELNAGFGLTVGAGFSSDVALRVGVVEGARLAAIVAARAGTKLWQGASFLADHAQRAIRALKKWATEGKGFRELRAKVKAALGMSADEVVATTDDDDVYAELEGEEGNG